MSNPHTFRKGRNPFKADVRLIRWTAVATASPQPSNGMEDSSGTEYYYLAIEIIL